jgi:hypothetical protein
MCIPPVGVVAHLFRGEAVPRVSRNNPASKEAGYSKQQPRNSHIIRLYGAYKYYKFDAVARLG